MENKTIKTIELIDFIKSIKRDIKWIGTEPTNNNIFYKLLSFVEEQEAKKTTNFTYDREYLEDMLCEYIEKYNESLPLSLEEYEMEDLNNFVKTIAKTLLPIWKDESKKYIKLSDLIEYYGLDIDDLYFDADSNCICDKEGNVWYD